MRKLVITRGHQGSGKSHALRQAGIAEWTLSSDTLRTVLASPMLVESGRMISNQDVNDRVFQLMAKLADERMDRGETLAIDTTLQNLGELSGWLKLARKHRYRVAVLDMSQTSLEAALARNLARSDVWRVNEAKVRQVHAIQAEAGPVLSEGVDVIAGRDDGSHVAALEAWLEEPVADLSSYSGIVHIGDLQGCHTVLAGPGGPLERGFRDDMFYVFVGDLLDRGIENGKVARWFRDEALGRKNVALLWGNHEDHLHRWARGDDAVSSEFGLRTLPQLHEEGFTREDADAVVSSALDFLRYRYRGTEVLVTHAGLSALPEKPHLVSLRQFSRGTGYWSDPVDQQFERNTTGVFQVHGHRNHGGVPVRATSRSFNLEDSVEHGGNLRTCTLDGGGWSVARYRNGVFRSMRERLPLERKVGEARTRERTVIPGWMFKGARETLISEGTLEAMRGHKGVKERGSELFPHVSSLNFTKQVFFDRSWDDVVVKARGLFFDTETREIVSRGYEKFFNVGERPETELAALAGKMSFPIKLYVKENGFLGNLGYDARTDRLFVASKSTPDGPFAEMFRKILSDTLDEARQERLRRYLRDSEASMTFEVIDPVNDPHMIEYEAPKVVLLDVLRRNENFEKADFEVVEAVGKRLGFDTKKLAITFRDARSFAGWYARATRDLSYRHGGKHVEGFVIEDANGFMTKVKLPYYGFWKRMRSMKDRILACREKGKDFSFNVERRPDGTEMDGQEREMAEAFRDWCLDQDNETLRLDVISLRKAFGRDFERTRQEDLPLPTP